MRHQKSPVLNGAQSLRRKDILDILYAQYIIETHRLCSFMILPSRRERGRDSQAAWSGLAVRRYFQNNKFICLHSHVYSEDTHDLIKAVQGFPCTRYIISVWGNVIQLVSWIPGWYFDNLVQPPVPLSLFCLALGGVPNHMISSLVLLNHLRGVYPLQYCNFLQEINSFAFEIAATLTDPK